MCYYGIVLILYLVQRPPILGSIFFYNFFIIILLSLFAMIFNVGEMLLQGLQWLDWSQVFIIVGVKCRHPNIIMRVIKSCFLSFSSLLKLSYVLLWYCLNTLFGTKAPHSWKFLFFIFYSFKLICHDLRCRWDVIARFAMVRLMITSFYNCWCKVQVPQNYKF